MPQSKSVQSRKKKLFDVFFTAQSKAYKLSFLSRSLLRLFIKTKKVGDTQSNCTSWWSNANNFLIASQGRISDFPNKI